METTQVIKSVIDLGTTGILLYFIATVWKDRHAAIESKDGRIKELSDKVLEVVSENIKVQEGLIGTIEAGTKASETLTTAVYEVLRKK